MNDVSFDDAMRQFASRWSRRGFGQALAGPVIGGALGILSLSAAGAKKNKKRKRKKKKKRKAPPPPPTATVRCDAFNTDTNRRRFAQTFIAPLSGTPASAEVFSKLNSDNFELLFEVRTVVESGFPSPSTVLAVGVVSNIPQHPQQSGIQEPPRRIVASFTHVVAPLVAGQRYALSVTGSSSWTTLYHFDGTACPEGKMFVDTDEVGPFSDELGDTDMPFALTITG